jgi:integrase
MTGAATLCARLRKSSVQASVAPPLTPGCSLSLTAGPFHRGQYDRRWERARLAAGRPDLRLHDLRHSGLTWLAAQGATTAELMRRGGHKNPRAALGDQHATQDRDRTLAGLLAALANPAGVVPFDRVSEPDGARGGHVNPAVG